MLFLLQSMLTLILGSKHERLAKESAEIFNIFTETVSKLEVVNTEIEEERLIRVNQIQKLTAEIDILTKTSTSNLRMKEKITQFINE